METMDQSTSSDDIVNIKEESTDESKINISVQQDDIKINNNNSEVDMSIIVNDEDDNKNSDDATDVNNNHVQKQ